MNREEELLNGVEEIGDGTAGELRRFMMQGMAWAWEFSLFEESLSLEIQDPLYRTVPEGCSSH